MLPKTFFFFLQAVFPAFRESHLEVYGYLELTLDFLPSLPRRQRSKTSGGSKKKGLLSSVEKSQHHFLNFPTTSSGLGSAGFRWRACVRQTQHSQPLAAVRPLPSAAGRHPFHPVPGSRAAAVGGCFWAIRRLIRATGQPPFQR